MPKEQNAQKQQTEHENPAQANEFRAPDNPLNQIGRSIAVLSGKGGVGKSMVTSLLASRLHQEGARVGVLDADITGPSIPRLFGVQDAKPEAMEHGLLPVHTAKGLSVMSVNLLLDTPQTPVVWRGPILSNMVKQFWSDVIWGDLDYLMLDMPPGTGDVPLTVFQSIPLDGIILVTSPQDLVSMIVGKAVNMARKMQIPILGLIENMSGVVCPHCGETFDLFGASNAEQTALAWDIPFLGRLPVDPELARLSDEGRIEEASPAGLDGALTALRALPSRNGPEKGTVNPGYGARKLAVAVEKDTVSDHFGYCDGFRLYWTQDGSIAKQEYMENPGHEPGLLPRLLREQEVQVVLAGGMGQNAVTLFQDAGIDVITGVAGEPDDAVIRYLDGRLESSGAVCHEHRHEDSCGEHS